MELNYFEPRHGKQLADGEGGIFKAYINKELKRQDADTLTTVRDVIAFANQHLKVGRDALSAVYWATGVRLLG